MQFSIPAWADMGATYARVRLSSLGYLQPTGEAADGEVEDYAVTLLSNLDLSDAPGYSPASHIIGGPYLGQVVDTEAALSGSDDTVGLADNDGVIFGEVQASGTAFVRVDAANVGVGAKLDAWIDFNADGDFRDAKEKIVASLAVVNGRNLIEFELPAGTVAGNTFARFRISSAGGLSSDSPDLPAADGEVEDYALTILPTRPQIAGSTFVTLADNDLLVQDIAGLSDSLTIRSDGEFLIVNDPNQILSSDLTLAHGSGTHTVRIPLAELADSIIVDTGDGDDKVTIDLSDSTLLARLTVRGGKGHDEVILVGADQAGASIDVSSVNEGTIDLASGHTLNYQAESIDAQLTIDDLSIEYSAADDSVQLTQTLSGIALNNQAASLFRFATPERLAIKTGDGEDTIRLDSNGAAVNGGSVAFITFDMVIDAGGQLGDELEIINSSDTLGDDVSITSDTIVSTGTRELFGNGSSLNYFGLDNLQLDLATANSTVLLNVDEQATSIELNMAAAPANELKLVSSALWDSLSITATTPTESVIDLAAIDTTVPTITVRNADSMDLSTLATDSVSLTYSDAAETITVADSGLAQVTQVSTSATGGATLRLSNPATAFTLTSGNTSTDVVVVSGFGSNFTAAVAVNAAEAADEVRWRATSTDLAGLSLAGGAIFLDSAAISSANEVRLAGPVTLAQNVSLTADKVIFEDGIVSSASRDLTITSAHIELHGSATLGSLQTHALVTSIDDEPLQFILEGDITATGHVDIQLPLIISGDIAVSGSLLEFDAIDAAEDLPEGSSAGLSLHGPARLRGDVGGNFAITTLDAQALTIATGSIRTLGQQTYAGAVLLATDVTLDGPADFAGPISGAAALTTIGEVTLRGVNTFQGPMIAAAGSLNVVGTLSSNVMVGNATLTGNGHLQGDVTLEAGGWLMPTPHSSTWLSIDGTLAFDSEAGFILAGANSNALGRVIAHQIDLNAASLFDELTFTPTLGQQLSFMQASVINGQFADVQSQEFLSVGGADVLAEYVTSPSTGSEFVLSGYGDGDYGDAPFDSLKSDAGAAHRAVGPTLGSSRGSESDGFTGDLQDDGVQVLSPLMVSSTSATLGAVAVTASAAAKLDAWIDFNQDGDWDDVGEQIFVSRLLSAGANTLSFTIPSGAASGDSYARFRLSSAGALAPTGVALDGEVEDHLFSFTSSTTAAALTLSVGGAATDIALESGQLVVRMGGQIVSRMPVSAVGSLIIEGDGQNNSVSIDASAIPVGGLWVRGNGDGDFDTLSVRQSSGAVTLLTHDFVNAHDGSVMVDGKAIHYTGLEPIIDTAVASERVFAFGDSDDIVTLGDAGVTTDGTSRLTSVDSSEAVDFTNPSASLILDLGEGDNRLIIGNLDSGLTVPTTLRFGSGTDQLLAVSGDLNLSGKNIQKTDGQLNVIGRATGTGFTTSGDFELSLTEGAQFSTAITFGNTGGVRLGDAATDVFDFTGGLTNVAGPTTLNGIVRTQNKPIVLGDVTLVGDTTLAGTTITLGDVTGVGNLVLTGNVILNGSIDIDGILTINGTLTLGTSVSIATKGTTVLSNAVQGGFDIINSGSGTLRLMNQNFAGQLIAEAGTVVLPNGFEGQLLVDGGSAVIAGSFANSITASAGMVRIGSGISSASLSGNLLLSDLATLDMQINGTVAGTSYDQLVIAGTDRIVNLNEATLALSLGFTPAVGSSYTLLNLLSPTSTIVGQLAGLPQNSLIQIGNSQFTINYAGGDGNDVVLTALA